MDDTNVSKTQVRVSDAGWLVLIARLPPKPDYLRVKLRRRIQRIGAVALRGAVYVLPNHPEAAEDFEWLRTELVADGGDAIIWAAAPVTGITDEELRGRFRDARLAGGRAFAPERASARAERDAAARTLRGRTWVTREGVFVDRIASACSAGSSSSNRVSSVSKVQRSPSCVYSAWYMSKRSSSRPG